MGRNHRRKNKWKRGDAAEEQLGQRRLRSGPGSGSDGGMPADGGDDDPESYTKPSSRSRGRRGSGKLRGGSHDDSISSGTTRKNVVAPTDGGHIPDTLTKEGGHDQNPRTAQHRTDAEVFAESPTKTNRDSKPSSASTLHAESGIPGGSPEEETGSPVRAIAPVDQQQEQQAQQPDVQAVQWQNTEANEKERGANEQENLLDINPEQLVAETNEKEGDVIGDGGLNNDDSNFGLPATSAGRGVVVPALPFGSTHINGDRGEEVGRMHTAVVVVDDKPHSLAWAGGRKGRPLMKSVENVLSEWLCAQEAKVGNHDTAVS